MRKRFYAGWLLLHGFCVLTVSCKSLLSDLAGGFTFLPHSLDKHWQRVEQFTDAVLHPAFTGSGAVEEAITAYLYGAGIERAYGFFAPGVPNSSKLIFELHYGDSRTEYELPRVSGTGTGVRLLNVLSYIGQTDSDPLRESIIKMLAYAIWQEHPDATSIRAIFGYVREPTIAEARQGTKESYHAVYVYDFSSLPQPAVH